MLDMSRRLMLVQAMASSVDVRQLGAKGNGIADDTAALQRAIDRTPSGGTLVLNDAYSISASLIIDKPMTITGDGQGFPVYTYDEDFTIRMTRAGVPAFILRANDKNFPFFQGHHGVFGIAFRNMKIIGPEKNNRTGVGIAVDPRPYQGDLHIRGLEFENITIRYFDVAIDLSGIAYLNNFYSTRLMTCNTGIRATRGKASDSGGQTRLYGCEIIACKTCLEWDYAGGTLSLFGCTLSESEFGLKVHESAGLAVFGSEFESLRGDAKSAGIYINIKNPDNPNSDASRTIVGNKFLASTHDIYIEKSSPAFAGGGINYPTLIDGNSFGSDIALRSDPALDQAGFVFGASNSGPGGQVGESQITGFKGVNLATAYRTMQVQKPPMRWLQLAGKGKKPATLHWFGLDPGQEMHFSQIERYALDMETGERSDVMCRIFSGDKMVAELSGLGMTSARIVNDGQKPVKYRLVASEPIAGRSYLISLHYLVNAV